MAMSYWLTRLSLLSIPDKRINEVVFAGSHDAGVTDGGGNTKTQDLDIYEQAKSGVRVFDVRITGAVVKQGGASKVVALKAYHGKGPESGEAASCVGSAWTLVATRSKAINALDRVMCLMVSMANSWSNPLWTYSATIVWM